ncbi:hypothetical protein ANN_19361 [Periplaneta americana]|uniref:Uncharacterized protein n=1 Tax=Periplaneta americana TaxID=6978 RepID=A0ABQ8SAK8_PERAM|nr:hypothetical protein ANN_19361 [Periplaneta americana]
MSPGSSTESFPAFARIGLRENPGKNLNQNVPCQQRLQMWFMHDGTSALFLRNVREHLPLIFHDRWIGRRSPTPWPARSPNLNPLDFWLWGHMKEPGYLASERNEGDNAGEKSPGSSTESYPAFARIGLRKTPEKTSTREQPPLIPVLGSFLMLFELTELNSVSGDLEYSVADREQSEKRKTSTTLSDRVTGSGPIISSLSYARNNPMPCLTVKYSRGYYNQEEYKVFLTLCPQDTVTVFLSIVFNSSKVPMLRDEGMADSHLPSIQLKLLHLDIGEPSEISKHLRFVAQTSCLFFSVALQCMKGQDRPAGCWPHVHIPKQRWTIIQPE